MFTLSKTSLDRLNGVHEDLAKIVLRAIQLSPVYFNVSEGLRSTARQKELVAAGKSKTMNSRHLTGHAVDLAPIVDGVVVWSKCKILSVAMFEAAKEYGIHIRWGGDFNENGIIGDDSFYDGPHFELSKKDYP